MKAILVGGGPIGPALEAAIRRLSVPVYHTYGMTETATHIALRRLNGAEASSAFVPLPRVELSVDDRGCLAIRGPMTADATLQTNDLVELRPDGSFLWLGRWDNVINSGGVKVQVEAVEQAIAAAGVRIADWPLAGRRYFVAGLPDERLGQVVALVVEGAALTPEQQTTVRGALDASLDRFWAPRAFVSVPHLVETPTGKIDRRASLALLSGRRKENS